MGKNPESGRREVSYFNSIYHKKLTKPQEAVARIPKKGNLAFGLGPSNPPALLAALADRVAAEDIEDLHLYYQLASEGARPLFRIDFLDRLHFHSNFMTGLDRQLIKEAGSSAVIDFMSCYLWQLPRVLTEFNHIDVFMITVSPMDKHGYFSLGT
ncbi:MAG TPA: 4-hydroxybutyrate--acetyl-CoA CoA transferase, partial [Desulfobacteria bacterium]|nr:4-hydroxybutyrate--acetyl-CoA CoA transferase [Desulfobacteria bacterium]